MVLPNANSKFKLNLGWQHISQHLDGACLEARQRESDAGKRCCTFPSRNKEESPCSDAVGSQENAGARGMLHAGLADAVDFSLLPGHPHSGLWVRHASLSCPLPKPGPWLPHWLAHRGGNEVHAFYKPIINISDTYNLWNLANQDLIWFISCFLPLI